ncbi:hypothetical protein [Paenibacillus sp. PL2-23]|uniref:hypothetical protein n=1 Tax=Paenibacillus sp. PL2-23 TaxID=2100729 RepID=UPI0030FBC5AA
MPYTKAVITDPYYDKPIWITGEVTRKEFLCLSAESSSHDVELFLTHLFGYMDINVEQSLLLSFNELFEQDYIALSGGVAFFADENNYILPSCCCGLEDYSNAIDSIINKQSPWMGHDPAPGLTYNNNQVYVWPDDPESSISNKYFIEFSYQELKENLEKTSKEIKGFIEGPLYCWIVKENSEIANTMRAKMKKWLLNE